jgi:TRAP-type C4-dicarboxylate transport system permease small subunit
MESTEDAKRNIIYGNPLLDKYIPTFSRTIIVGAQLCLTLLIVASVVARYLFSSGLYGVDEFILVFAFWLYMIGGTYGSYEDSHIKADIVDQYVKSALKRHILKIINLSVTLIVSIFITVWAYDYVVWGFTRKAKSIAWKIPMVIPQGAIFVGFIIMTIYTLALLVMVIKKGYKEKETE